MPAHSFTLVLSWERFRSLDAEESRLLIALQSQFYPCQGGVAVVVAAWQAELLCQLVGKRTWRCWLCERLFATTDEELAVSTTCPECKREGTEGYPNT
jgi:hypothetical protein